MKKDKRIKELKILGLSASLLSLYALWNWKKQQDKTNLVMGYLKDHVKYHKDNGIPFGPEPELLTKV